MSEWLTVDDIGIARLPGGRTMLLEQERGSSSYFVIRVTVTNHSPNQTAYATGAITGIEYEAQHRALRVHFTAPDASNHEQPRPVVVEHIPIGPGADTVIEARIASPVTYLDRVSETGWRPHVVYLDSDVDKIELTVTYANKPPPPRLNLAAESTDFDAIWQSAHGMLRVTPPS